jgi:hypothetical protein
MIDKLIFLAALLLTIPVAILSALALVTPVTLSGALYLIGLGLLIGIGLITPWFKKHAAYPVILVAPLLLLLGVAGARLLLTQGGPHLQMQTWPGNRNSRWLNRLIDEQDVSLFALRPLLLTGMVTGREMDGIWPAFSDPYREIRQREGLAPSPFVSTYLGLQRPSAFDVLFIPPETTEPADTAVIFLHGFAGNFTYQCWLFAQAVRAAGILTVCPSTNWIGLWSRPNGAATVEATLAQLRQNGVRRFYLAGLSNGGVGASELAPHLAADLDGLILLSGLLPGAEQVNVPVLIIHSRQDERMPVSIARNYAAAAGDRATYVEMDGDHFVLAKEPAKVQQVITDWLVALR